MFGINLEELLVLAVLAFILFGPQKLPEYAETLGRFIAKIRQASNEITREVQNPFQYPPPSEQPHPSAAPSYDACPACRQPVNREFTFCPGCGYRLKEPPAQQSLAS